jgi:hypothetical protein
MAQLIAQSTSRVLALTITLLLLAVISTAASTVGTITTQTGPVAEIRRNKDSIPTGVSTPVEMNDSISTANVQIGITFKDDSKVQITEQSRLVIDSFVFDNTKQDAGKVGLKVALGTARFASGQIAKINPQNIKIETPTATVGVRGTDFTLTVDEIGRSLIILLPSCPTGWKNIEKDCIVGVITVTSDMGTVIMNQAFQSTVITAREVNPSRPAILKLTADQINNLLIVTPPREVRREMENSSVKTALDVDFLNQDFLKYDELNTNQLDKSMGRLDINYLDTAFLFNMLDYMNSSMLENALNEEENPMLPKFRINSKAGLKFALEDTQLTLFRTSPQNFSQITLDKDSETSLIIKQEDLSMTQIINRSGGTSITIRQGN